MKKIIFYTLAIISLSGCAIGGVSGNGNVTEEKRELSGFDQVSVSGALEVILKQGDSFSVMVRADENLIGLVNTEVMGTQLKLSTKENIRESKALEVYIMAPSFTGFDCSGATELRSSGELNGKNLELDLSGASEVNLSLDYKKIDSDLSGASEVELQGKVEKIRIEASGASELRLFELQAEQMSLDLSGASEANLFVTKSLEIEASGASEVSYKGNPTIESDLSGAASIKAVN